MRSLLTISFCLIAFSAAFSQTGSIGAPDAVSAGMGKAYTVASRGVYALGTNPANIALGPSSTYQFSVSLPFPNMHARTGADFMTINDYNDLFGWDGLYDRDGEKHKNEWTEEDEARLLELFQNGSNSVTSANVQYLAFAGKVDALTGAFGFQVQDVSAVNIEIPYLVAELLLDGNKQGQLYDFTEVEAAAWALRKYSLTYASNLTFIEQKSFKQMAFGLSLNFVQGFAYTGLDRTNTQLTTGSRNTIEGVSDMLAQMAFSTDLGIEYEFGEYAPGHTSSIGPFMEPAGAGVGVDVGFSALVDDAWSFGISLTDIGTITWDANAVEYAAQGDIYLDNITDEAQRDTLIERLTGEGRFVESFATPMATALHLGVGFRVDAKAVEGFPGEMLVTLDIHRGFNHSPGNTTIPRMALGVDWKPGDWLPVIRTGFSAGGGDRFGWAFGIGYQAGPLEVNFATTDMVSVLSPNTAHRFSVALGSRWTL